MKKYLLGTSALVAAGMMAGQANAADKISLSLGGFIEEWFGYSDKSEDKNRREWAPWGLMTDGEIHFKGSVNLDNGMKVTARAEIEMNSDKQNVSIDEVWLQISSDALGMIEVGEQDSITDSIVKSWGGYGIGLGDVDKWIFDTPGIGGESPESAKITGGSEDQTKINYYTPAAWQKLTGLQGSVTFAPNNFNNDSEGNVNNVTEGNNAYALGLTYSQELMGVNTYIAYGYYKEDTNTRAVNDVRSITGHQISANFKYGDWEMGGGYVRSMDEFENIPGSGIVTDTADGFAYNFGLGYTMGQWQFSVERMYVKNGQTNAIGGKGAGARRTVHMADAAYNLGGGIKWATSIFTQNIRSEEANNQDVVNDGWGIVTGLVASF